MPCRAECPTCCFMALAGRATPSGRRFRAPGAVPGSRRPAHDPKRGAASSRHAAGGSGLFHVQPALALGGFLPPPASSPLVLARANGARARLTTDRDEAVIVQRVVRDALAPDVLPDLRRAPARQGIELEQPAASAGEIAVEFQHVHVRACRALIATLPGGPGAQRGERTLQRLHLADPA